VLLSLFLAASLFAFLKALGPIAVVPPKSVGVPASGEVGERPAVIWYAGTSFYAYAMWAWWRWCSSSGRRCCICC
jgi:hypothetical protein